MIALAIAMATCGGAVLCLSLQLAVRGDGLRAYLGLQAAGVIVIVGYLVAGIGS